MYRVKSDQATYSDIAQLVEQRFHKPCMSDHNRLSLPNMNWEEFQGQEKYKGHVCYPSPTSFFGRATYQCGCGKYFSTEEDAEKQRELWREKERKLMDK